MTRPSGPAVWIAAGLVWLAAFSLLFTGGSAIGLWPAAPSGEWGRYDLPVGLGFGAALGLALLWRPRAQPLLPGP